MEKTKVLFVCLGNICRSPTAEGIFKYKMEQKGLSSRFEHDSAGTSAYHAGERPDPRSQEKALEKGIDLNFIRSRQFITEDYYAFDYIFAMDEKNYRDIMDDRPENATAKIQMMLDHNPEVVDKNVPDPYWTGAEGFELVFQLLDTAVENFINEKSR